MLVREREGRRENRVGSGINWQMNARRQQYELPVQCVWERERDSATFGGQWKSIIHALGHAAEKYARHATTQPPPESMQQFLQLPTDNREATTLHPLFATLCLSHSLPLSLYHSHSLFGHLFVFDLRQLWLKGNSPEPAQVAWQECREAWQVSCRPRATLRKWSLFNTKAAKWDEKKWPKWKV